MSAEKLKGGPPRRTVANFCAGRPAGLTVMVPSWACSLTTMRRKGAPADGFSGDHQIRVSGDSRQASDAWAAAGASRNTRNAVPVRVAALCILGYQ